MKQILEGLCKMVARQGEPLMLEECQDIADYVQKSADY
jgi:hypothetical protein